VYYRFIRLVFNVRDLRNQLSDRFVFLIQLREKNKKNCALFQEEEERRNSYDFLEMFNRLLSLLILVQQRFSQFFKFLI
jgi:hypothetical protein